MPTPPFQKNRNLLEAVRSHTGKPPLSPLTGTLSGSPVITIFGTVTVSTAGVQIRDFSTQNTPKDGDLPRLVIDWAIERLLAARELFGPRPTGIEKYTTAIRHSLRSQNWFGALFLALAMPDICGALESPTEKPNRRYTSWFDRYLSSNYAPALFSAEDCYYLRCAALHQGLSEHPKAQNKQVVFITPPPGGSIFHSNFIESQDGTFVLQLQIDIFCGQICTAIERWKQDVEGNAQVEARIAELLEFQDPASPLKSKA